MSREIEELIRSHSGTLIVLLTEPFLESAEYMDSVFEEISELRPDVRIVRAVFSLHREWAEGFNVYGSPCALVFRDGELCAVGRGLLTVERILDLLERAAL